MASPRAHHAGRWGWTRAESETEQAAQSELKSVDVEDGSAIGDADMQCEFAQCDVDSSNEPRVASGRQPLHTSHRFGWVATSTGGGAGARSRVPPVGTQQTVDSSNSIGNVMMQTTDVPTQEASLMSGPGRTLDAHTISGMNSFTSIGVRTIGEGDFDASAQATSPSGDRSSVRQGEHQKCGEKSATHAENALRESSRPVQVASDVHAVTEASGGVPHSSSIALGRVDAGSQWPLSRLASVNPLGVVEFLYDAVRGRRTGGQPPEHAPKNAGGVSIVAQLDALQGLPHGKGGALSKLPAPDPLEHFNDAHGAESTVSVSACENESTVQAMGTEVASEEQHGGHLASFDDGDHFGFMEGHRQGHYEGFMQGHQQGEQQGIEQGVRMGIEQARHEMMNQGNKADFIDAFKLGYAAGYGDGYNRIDFGTEKGGEDGLPVLKLGVSRPILDHVSQPEEAFHPALDPHIELDLHAELDPNSVLDPPALVTSPRPSTEGITAQDAPEPLHRIHPIYKTHSCTNSLASQEMGKRHVAEVPSTNTVPTLPMSGWSLLSSWGFRAAPVPMPIFTCTDALVAPKPATRDIARPLGAMEMDGVATHHGAHVGVGASRDVPVPLRVPAMRHVAEQLDDADKQAFASRPSSSVGMEASHDVPALLPKNQDEPQTFGHAKLQAAPKLATYNVAKPLDSTEDAAFAARPKGYPGMEPYPQEPTALAGTAPMPPILSHADLQATTETANRNSAEVRVALSVCSAPDMPAIASHLLGHEENGVSGGEHVFRSEMQPVLPVLNHADVQTAPTSTTHCVVDLPVPNSPEVNMQQLFQTDAEASRSSQLAASPTPLTITFVNLQPTPALTRAMLAGSFSILAVVAALCVRRRAARPGRTAPKSSKPTGVSDTIHEVSCIAHDTADSHFCTPRSLPPASHLDFSLVSLPASSPEPAPLSVSTPPPASPRVSSPVSPSPRNLQSPRTSPSPRSGTNECGGPEPETPLDPKDQGSSECECQFTAVADRDHPHCGAGDVAAEEIATPLSSRWRYEPENGLNLSLRAEPSTAGTRTEEILQPGDVFDVVERFAGPEGELLLRLADGRGWAFDELPGVGRLCVLLSDDHPRTSCI